MPADDWGGTATARWVVARRTARRAVRSGALWGAVFGVAVVARVSEFTSQFPTAAARADLVRTLSANPGIAILFGPPRRVDTAGGYTALVLGVLVVLGAAGGLLAATRLARGEEEAGRWELYLTGQTTRRGAALQAAAGLGIGVLALWTVAAVVTVAVGSNRDAGFSVTASVFFATALAAGPALFAAVGLLASQLTVTRRGANFTGAGILGGCFLIRAVADSGSGLGGLRWASPLGWVHELRPLTGSRPLALAPILVFIGGLSALAVWLAGRRDLGAGILPSRDAPPPRTNLLGGQLGLTVRLTRPVAAGWAAGLATFGFVFGLIAVAVGETFGRSEGFQEMIGRLGGQRSGTESYLGMAFLVAAALLAFAAAGQVAAIRAEEADGHLDHLLARPVGRQSWLAGRLAISALMVVGVGFIAGLCAWAGAATKQGGPGLGPLVGAGLNITSPALFVLGVGGLAFAVWPRWAPTITYTVVAWSVLVEFVGATAVHNRLLLDTSLLGHLAPAPAANPNWTIGAWLVALGLLSAAAGASRFARRDLAGA